MFQFFYIKYQLRNRFIICACIISANALFFIDQNEFVAMNKIVWPTIAVRGGKKKTFARKLVDLLFITGQKIPLPAVNSELPGIPF